MQQRISAGTSSETIRELRENGREPIFNVDEHKTLSEIMNEIDWSEYTEAPEEDSIFESTREPVWHLDASIEEQLVVRPHHQNRRTAEEELTFDF